MTRHQPSGAPVTRRCLLCEASYLNDQTPMGQAGYCLTCRPQIQVTCTRCQTPCPGAFDGQHRCAACRAAPLGVQQYEDRHATRIATRQHHPEPLPGSASRVPRHPRRVLVTGSRAWTDTTTIRAALAAVWHPATTLVTGACPHGADHLSAQCWTHWGGQVEQHPADWPRHDRAAGPLRNQHMVALGADLCLAFIHNHSPGATHCADTAEQAGIPTRRHHQHTHQGAA